MNNYREVCGREIGVCISAGQCVSKQEIGTEKEIVHVSVSVCLCVCLGMCIQER